jgi:uncharacterized protein YciI
MWKQSLAVLCGLLAFSSLPAAAQSDPELAKSLGGNEMGMKKYVLVILKTGPNKMPAGAERDNMFKAHFANMQRLADEKKLALAGPLDGVDGWRGVFVIATDNIDEAKKIVATDPVIINGEMVGEFHAFFASAGLMAVGDIHKKISKQK